MPLALARKTLGQDAIIGVSVSSVEEARIARDGGADYVGIGAVWPTGSKDVTAKTKLGPEGTGEVLDVLAGSRIEAVAIGMANKLSSETAKMLTSPGGIHLPNLAHLLHGSIGPESRNHLSGIAVISDIVASQQPKEAALALRDVLDSFKTARQALQHPRAIFAAPGLVGKTRSVEDLLAGCAQLMKVVRDQTPLVHQVSACAVSISRVKADGSQITNNVVINDSANATLAVGASPIMATNPRDCADLSKAIGALLINFGTITDKEGMLVAGESERDALDGIRFFMPSAASNIAAIRSGLPSAGTPVSRAAAR